MEGWINNDSLLIGILMLPWLIVLMVLWGIFEVYYYHFRKKQIKWWVRVVAYILIFIGASMIVFYI